QHLPARRPQYAGQEIDERCLARSVGTDERVARTGLELKIDVAGGGERAEGDAQIASLEQRRGHAPVRRVSPRATAAPRPRMPFFAKSAITTSRRPSPSCHAVG